MTTYLLLIAQRYAGLIFRPSPLSASAGHCRFRGLVWAILVMYVVTNLGLPVGFGSVAASHLSAGGCRCSAEAQAAGRCCCRKVVGPRTTGCCSTRIAAPTKSCCAKPATPSELQSVRDEGLPAPTEPEKPGPRILSGGCPCGPVDSPLMLICPQHRILSDSISLDLVVDLRESRGVVAGTPCGNRPRPCVPPPELFLV